MQKLIVFILIIVAGISLNNSTGSDRATKLSQRPTVETISNAVGEIRKIGDTDIYMIWCQDKFLKLNVINLPEKFRQQGLKINFSGNIKSTNTLEDEWGDLFELTSIN